MTEEFNRALINGDMDKVRKLLSEGKSWVGSKLGFDTIPKTYPSNPKDFSEYLKLVLDLNLCDGNYVEGEDEDYDDSLANCFEWFFTLSEEELQKLKKLSCSKLSEVYFRLVIAAYTEAVAITKEFSDPKDLIDPQIIIGKSGGSYNIRVEAYIDDGSITPCVSLEVDNEQILDIFSKLSLTKPYTC